MSPLEVALLLIATAEAVAIAALIAERRRFELALRDIGRDVRAVLDAAEHRADADAHEERDPHARARPIGFRV